MWNYQLSNWISRLLWCLDLSIKYIYNKIMKINFIWWSRLKQIWSNFVHWSRHLTPCPHIVEPLAFHIGSAATLCVMPGSSFASSRESDCCLFCSRYMQNSKNSLENDACLLILTSNQGFTALSLSEAKNSCHSVSLSLSRSPVEDWLPTAEMWPTVNLTSTDSTYVCPWLSGWVTGLMMLTS